MASPSRLLQLPLELREEIYRHYFDPTTRLRPSDVPGTEEYRFEFELLRTSKQVYDEGTRVFRRTNVFVRVETPWPQAVAHISHDGLVPIVLAPTATSLTFKLHTATITISSPSHNVEAGHVIILLLRDVSLFSQVWYYSSLNYSRLNEHLRVEIELRDPYYPADPKPIPRAIQEKLLLPFGMVKGLSEVEVRGFDDAVKRELEKRMAIPYDTVGKCCDDCMALTTEGDVLLEKENNPEAALDMYVKAFHAIHILIRGRTRRVLADHFFHRMIDTGSFSGQTGTVVRIVLRLKLVSRVVNVYLKQGEWAEAAFWGMRTISIMREAMETSEFEDFINDFVGGMDMGSIYLRTGIAFRKLEETSPISPALGEYAGLPIATSSHLFKFAGKYLKQRFSHIIKKELEDMEVRGVGDEAFVYVERGREADSESMEHMDQEVAEAELAVQMLVQGLMYVEDVDTDSDLEDVYA
ncbi:hypothetical protein P154DRAFT_521219 [Amniculicola lignicola CBS 123094]|uniref:Uncharacterized protein n=1 Tax=Amniculicola lignicola CBS 123094 TaxID=1392246 RepID=A0A6A5WPG1_9PLEO|nr:hypothetical protein P154DRAFT_521219 [Amniculicola lignicola CBS 123094]